MAPQAVTFWFPISGQGPSVVTWPLLGTGTMAPSESLDEITPEDLPKSEKKIGGFTRAWMYTFWKEEDVHRLNTTAPKCHVVGKEVCPTTGKVHWQGYIRFKEKHRGSWWQNQFPGTRARPRFKSEKACVTYCRKDRDMVYDYGVGDGDDDDPWMDVLKMIMEGEDLHDIFYAHPRTVSNRWPAVITTLRHVRHWKKNPDRRGEFFAGMFNGAEIWSKPE